MVSEVGKLCLTSLTAAQCKGTLRELHGRGPHTLATGGLWPPQPLEVSGSLYTGGQIGFP